MSKVYVGRRTSAGCVVTVQGISSPNGPKALDPRFDVRSHSPDGFEWGYGGSGPAQLALAILCDHLGDSAEAQAWYQAFKFRVIGAIKDCEFILTSEEIQKELDFLKGGGANGKK